MTQLIIKLDKKSVQALRRAARKNAKPLEEFARELLRWYAERDKDPLFTWKPLKNSSKRVKNSAHHHDKYLYGKK